MIRENLCVGKDFECSLREVKDKVRAEPCWQNNNNNNSTLMFVTVTHTDK